MKQRRVVIITGASSGIGLALAELAARRGYDVVAVGRRAERLETLRTLVAHATGRVHPIAVDITQAGAPARIVREALAEFGGVDVLVNNAGGVAVGPIAQQSDAELREQTETHVVAPLALLREALPALRERRGQVFFVGSGVARIPVGTLGAYPAAKAAVRNLTRIVRGELRADGIAVTYVDPGAVATEFMTRAGFAGPPPGLAAAPYAVARRIFAAFTTRPAAVNGVPWQTTLVALGERFPALTDALLARMPQIVGGERTASAEPPAVPERPQQPEPPQLPELPEPPAPPVDEPGPLVIPHVPVSPSVVADSELDGQRSEFERALAPVAERMRRLKLSRDFVAELLVPGTVLSAGDIALKWTGMPNKNERALTIEVLAALAAAGFVTPDDTDAFRVARTA